MPTEKQIAANRLNAQKSTGPKTDAGKLTTRLNSLKHGLAAQLTVLPFESQAEYDALENDLLEDTSSPPPSPASSSSSASPKSNGSSNASPSTPNPPPTPSKASPSAHSDAPSSAGIWI